MKKQKIALIIKDSYFILSSTVLTILTLAVSTDLILRFYYNSDFTSNAYNTNVKPYPIVQEIYRLSGYTTSDIKDLLESTYSYQGPNGESNWSYASYLGFQETPRSTRFVNISKFGFRRNTEILPSDNDFLEPVSRNSHDFTKKIYFFGGSTGFGYGVGDKETIPAKLGELLPNYKIFNFSRGYYYSEQENILLDRLLIGGAQKPELVIFLDGINERGDIETYQKEMAALFKKSSNKAYSWSLSEAFKPFVYILSKLKSKLPDNKSSRVGVDISTQSYSRYSLPEQSLSKIFKENLKTRESICKKHKLKCITFIQPYPDNKTHFLASTERKKYFNSKFQSLKGKANTIDITESLSNQGIHSYVDRVHYSPHASSIIANRMAQEIESWSHDLEIKP